MVYLRKDLIQGSFVILAKNCYIPLTFWIYSKVFFQFCVTKGAKSYMKILLVFWEKSFIWGNVIFLGYFLLFDWVWSKLNQPTVNIRSLNSQDMISFIIITGSWNMIRILIRSGHDFSDKRQCNGWCMNLILCFCEEVNIQQKVVLWKSFFKNLLHNFVWM